MKRKLRKIWLSIICLVFIGSVSVFAVSETSVIYHFFSEKVAVHIEEYTLKDGKRVPWENGVCVLPGDYLTKIPVIYNDGVDCYVRTQVSIISEKEASVPLTMENIEGIGENWILIDDYFYCRDVLLENGEVTFFEGIHIPVEWESVVDSDNQWEINVKVEAVQAKYVTPNFNSDDPWNMKKENYEILDAMEDEPMQEKETQESILFTIESQLEGFQVGIEENYQSMGGFIPGDTKERIVTIQNQDKKDRTVYVTADLLEKTILMEAMDLTILWETKGQETILYHGDLIEVKEMNDFIKVSVPGNSCGTMVFRVALPKEANNIYAAKEGTVKFIFTNEIPEIIPSENPNISNPVKTGDEADMWLWFVGVGIGVIGLLACVLWRKERFYDS